MGKTFICSFSRDELIEIYNRDGMTLKRMCKIVGCKSDITLAKILHQNDIDTDFNGKTAYAKRGNRTDQEFKDFLLKEYINNKRSMTSIAKELNISWTIVSRYLDKYNIPKRNKSQQQKGEHSSNWNGGKNLRSNGYIEIYSPNHPNKNARGYVYEHQLVAEMMLGRYLKENEVVHHIDFNKTNNESSNLIVLTNSEHVKLHHFLKEMPYEKAITKVKVISCK